MFYITALSILSSIISVLLKVLVFIGLWAKLNWQLFPVQVQITYHKIIIHVIS